MKINKTHFYVSIVFLIAFILWTALISTIDVSPIGPNESRVGFSTLNEFVHNLTGTNMMLYIITDWLGLVPILFALGFAILGLIQLIKRKSIMKVERSILLLGIFYILVISVYILFENIIINYRPILLNGYLEASYPSSTTMLVTTVMPTSIMQFKLRINNKKLRNIISFAIILFCCFMVIGRLLSGVHWITDIIGGMILSIGLVSMYRSFLSEF